MSTTDIVQKLWNLCHVLRDDGITYHQYVTELTYLLFLKMMKETDQEKQLPKGYRWADLEGTEGVDQLKFYRQLLLHLGSEGAPRVQSIYANASTANRFSASGCRRSSICRTFGRLISDSACHCSRIT